MDKARANFDSENATKDEYGNITAKNQNGIDTDAVPRKTAKLDATLNAHEKDSLPIRGNKNT